MDQTSLSICSFDSYCQGVFQTDLSDWLMIGQDKLFSCDFIPWSMQPKNHEGRGGDEYEDENSPFIRLKKNARSTLILFVRMTEPRAIHTNHGSRIQCVLGKDDSYLLILNYDDGDKQWQEHFHSGVPAGLSNQLAKRKQSGQYLVFIEFFQVIFQIFVSFSSFSQFLGTHVCNLNFHIGVSRKPESICKDRLLWTPWRMACDRNKTRR